MALVYRRRPTWLCPMSPKYIAGPMSSRLNARFIPHMGKRVPNGMLMTMSTYLVFRSLGLTSWVGAS